MKKPSIAIVGAGNLARVLAVCLRDAGYKIPEVITRDESDSQRRGQALAKQVNASWHTYQAASLDADLIWICVTDDAIADAASTLAKQSANWRGKTIFHSSGALTSEELLPLKKQGAAIASVHPMNTFTAETKPDLKGTPFALEGDSSAVALANGIARKLSVTAEVFTVKPENKVFYHAIGSFSSPLLVSLLEAGEQVAKAAGIKDANAVRGAILRRTLENYLVNGAAAAFSGPLRRGDAATVKKHLQALEKYPDLEAVYRILSRNALKRLPVKDPSLLD